MNKYRVPQREKIAIFISNPAGNFVRVNRTAAEMTGYSETELLTLNISDLVPPPVYTIAISAFPELPEWEGYYLRNCFVRRDGSRGIWDVHSIRVPDDLRMTMARVVQQVAASLSARGAGGVLNEGRC